MNNILETQLRMTMDALSNGVAEIDDDLLDHIVEEAGEQCKQALRKQLDRKPQKFRMRPSNLGRPLCQLLMEKSEAEREKMPYNHIFRMMYGDMTEILVEVLAKISKVNITGGKSSTSVTFSGQEIVGENDIEIDGKVYDTKSTSPWAYDNKWTDGWAGVRKDDAFGYCAQLLAYSADMPMGGWIVVNKSTGELRVVEAQPTESDLDDLRSSIENTLAQVGKSDGTLIKCFEPMEEQFRRVPTGSKRLHTTCTFCSYKRHCWPDAVYKPQTGSKAQSPRYYWYSEYAGGSNNEPS